MNLIAIHRRRHYSGHSTTPPHRPSPSPSPYKRAPPPRSIPHLSHPSPVLLPSSPLASIGASTAARSMPLRAHLRPSSASATSPPASPSSPTPPWLLTMSFSAPKHHFGRSLVTLPPCSPAVPPTAAVPPASFFPVCGRMPCTLFWLKACTWRYPVCRVPTVAPEPTSGEAVNP
jgi:hypothetical protein